MLNSCEFFKLCKLAKVSVTEEERPLFLERLNGIFDWVQELQSIDTSNVVIEIGEAGYSREDVCSLVDKRDQVLSNTKSSNTKSSKYGMFSVPKVVEYE
ncbi:MAG: aspartyl/glutamyl-tRNA amidotransferase subunit C [Holosporales bacterium]|jgi:aspartyl/glutamyl-tRNA(Asn/Gln) amidotransferase C subunit|nr:aspartyl/glutamyl-tRNA amidotransferase subunit C [Holosporales bacterium]